MAASHPHAAGAPGAAVPDHRIDRAARQAVVATFGTLGVLSAAVLVRDPLHQTVFPPCPFHAVTGLWCPGCGATRASGLLLRGHPVEALHYNALWVVAAPAVVYALVRWARRSFGRRGPPALAPARPVAIAAIVAIVAFSVIRNLPGFELLNPLQGA